LIRFDRVGFGGFLARRMEGLRFCKPGLGIAEEADHQGFFGWAALDKFGYRRWSIELFFRDIKTTMHMEVLRCKSPAMIEKEIAMHAAAYNAIRGLILNSAIVHQQELGRVSFKGALDLLRQWLPRAAACYDKPGKLRDWLDELLTSIAQVQNPHRPGRREPRAKKRRPKSYQMLTKPRHKFREIAHRENYRRAA
jgi:hypothetical protein